MTFAGAARVPRPRNLWLGLLIVALAARLAFVATAPPRILWPDGREYEAVALSLLEHGTYGTQTLRPPGYPTFIAGVYALLGPDLTRLRLVEALVATLAVGLVGVVGTGLFGPSAGFAAAALAALHPVLAFLPSTQYTENVLGFVLVLAFGATFVAWRRGGMARWALAGALFGLACLVRPNAALLLPGLGTGLALGLARARQPWLGPAAAFAATLVLAIAPWIVRNHGVHGEWFFIATGGGRQFWLGNNERATARTDTLIWFDSTTTKEIDRLPNPAARERYLYRKGVEFARREPGRAAGLYLAKLGNLFALYPEPYSRTLYVSPVGRAAQGLASAVVFAGALLALARLPAEPRLWPLVGAIVSFALTNAVFFTVMRYRMAFEPCLLWMAGLGWAATPWGRALARRLGLGR